jgi:hypothetical protein
MFDPPVEALMSPGWRVASIADVIGDTQSTNRRTYRSLRGKRIDVMGGAADGRGNAERHDHRSAAPDRATDR